MDISYLYCTVNMIHEFLFYLRERIGFTVGYLLFFEKLKLRAREAQYHSIVYHALHDFTRF